MNNIKFISPFKRLCVTIGNLPTAYMESMSYYECITFLVKFLENEVIPTVNNNSEVVKELQDYVAHYFDNLDVQEEINNKLDDMAESGELVTIIGAYLEIASVLGFDTKSDLKSAENLINGSFVKTLGDLTYNDGKGNFYKIRNKTEEDVIDDDEIVGLTNLPLLIAEKIVDYEVNQNTERIKQLENYKNRKYLFVGDSYATGYQGAGEDNIEGFYTKVVNHLGLTAQIIAHNGSGFLGMENTNKWITWLQTETIPNKDTFTDVFLMGGMNDSDNVTNLRNAMEECITYIKTNFPNAIIHIGCIGRYKEGNNSDLERLRKVDRIYQIVSARNGCKYIEGSFILLHHRDWYIAADNIHPNADGEAQLAYGLEQYILNGEINDFMSINSAYDYSADTITPAENITLSSVIYSTLNKEKTSLFLTCNVSFTENITIDNLDDIVIGKLTSSYVCSSANNQGLNNYVEGYVYSVNEINGSHFVKVGARLYNDSSNNLHLKFFTVMDNGNVLNDLEITGFNMAYGAIRFDIDSRMC